MGPEPVHGAARRLRATAPAVPS
ncbi:MAG: hypothetical protein RIS86_1176, partial [Planctomycetota bacterium]